MAYKSNQKYYSKIELKANNLIFSSLYNVHITWQRFLISIAASMGIALIYWFFIQSTGVYSAGLSAFSQGLSRLAKVLIIKNDAQALTLANNVANILFWTLFIVLNVPLAIIFYFKLGKKFTLITIVSFVISDLFGLILGFIPNYPNFVYIFGNPLSASSDFQKYGVQILFWHDPTDLVRVISLMFYAIVPALLLPFLYSIIYIVGSSTGGTDFISYYYSIKKRKPLGTSLAIFNTTSLVLGTVIGSYLATSLITPTKGDHYFAPWSFGLFLSPNLIASALSSIIMGVITNYLFPKTKMAKVKIYAADVSQITDHMLANQYPHAFTIAHTTGAYSKKPTTTAETICQYIEVPFLLKDIAEIAPNALIYVQLLDQVQGTMNILEKVD